MSLKNLVVTNDDGIQSPFLAPLLINLKAIFPGSLVSFCVPNQEQSWISQAITRRDPINVEERAIAGVSGFSSTGFPADCVNLAIDNLYDAKPDLIISGINIGVNAGVPYYLYSGTVAAARAAFLRQVRSIALSLSVPAEIYALWKGKDDVGFQEYAERFNQIALVASRVCDKLCSEEFWKDVDFFSVNFPWNTDDQTESAFYPMNRPLLKSVFSKESDGTYIHNAQGLEFVDANSMGDFSAVKQGKIAITPIRYTPNALCPQSLLDDLNSIW